MPKPVAIVDNSFMAQATLLNEIRFLDRIRLLFDHLLFPEEVIKEFTPRKDIPENKIRNQIIGSLSVSQGFYRICNSKDQMILTFLKSIDKVDAGEAEAISQASVRSIPFILIDDKKAIVRVQEKFGHLRFFNVLTLISLLELNELLPSYQRSLELYYGIRRFNSRELREAYIVAAAHLGLNKSKKEISQKTSLTKLGIGKINK
ncbi:MAG: hypothetical protein ABJG47_14715 [Ekhidna sp.]